MKTKKVSMIIAAFIIVLTFGAFFAPKVVNAASADNAAAVSQTEDSNAAATTASADTTTGAKAIAAAIAIGFAAGAGALGMGIAVSKANEGISRQPEATGQIRTTLMLGLVFIETAIIYALIVAILIVFVM